MKLIKQQEYPLLSRTRYIFDIEHVNGATPSKESLKEQVAKAAKSKSELVEIRHVFGKYGIGFSKIIAHVYTDAEVMKYLEAKKVKKEKK